MRFSELERSQVLSIVERSYLAFSYMTGGLKPCVTITAHPHDHWYTSDLALLISPLMCWTKPDEVRCGVESVCCCWSSVSAVTFLTQLLGHGDIWLLTHAALQHCRQLISSLSDEGMSTGVLSCHMSIMALNVHNTLSISIWPSLLKTRWRDVASTPPGPHTPHHTLGKLVTKASWWQPSSSVSMYPCIPALQLCSVSMYPGPAACRVVEPSSASARGYRGPRHWLHSLMAASTRHINSFIRPQPPRDAWGYPNFWRCIPACRIAGWDCQV